MSAIDSETYRVIGLAGSLRRDSFNRRLLEAAAELAPDGLSVLIHPIGRIPLYDADVEAAGLPPSVARLKTAIADADGLLIVTPEYNAGIPGVLKNAIDWVSRPAFASPFVELPVALMAASPGRRGGRRALAHLRDVLASTLAETLPDEVSVAGVHQRLDGTGISDPALEREVRHLLDRLHDRLLERSGRRPAAARAG
jgi:chromate reductase